MFGRKKEHHLYTRMFFVLAGFVTTALGISLLFFPGEVTNIFLEDPIQANGLFFIRFAGTSLLGFSLLNFYARNKSLELLRLAAMVNIASLLPATVISVWTYNGNYIDHYQWLIVFEHLFFLSGFVLCLVSLHLGKMSE